VVLHDPREPLTSPLDLRGRRVLVAGGRVSGRAVIPALLEVGASVTVADSDTSSLEACADLGVDTVSMDAIATDRDAVAESALVVTSPGFRPDSPLLTTALTVGGDRVHRHRVHPEIGAGLEGRRVRVGHRHRGSHLEQRGNHGAAGHPATGDENPATPEVER
jgi:hypothetical protein